jgi:hypothetical protein
VPALIQAGQTKEQTNAEEKAHQETFSQSEPARGGKKRLPPFRFEITNCDLKDWNSSVVN